MNCISDAEFERQLQVLEQGAPLRKDLPPEDVANLALASRLLEQRQVVNMKRVTEGYNHITRVTGRDIHSQNPIYSPRPHRLVWRVAAAALIVLVSVAMSSLGVRAAVLQSLENIGDLWFSLVNRIYVNLDQGSVYYPPFAEADAIRAKTPFEFGVPTWVPDGYVLQDEIHHASDYSWIVLTWDGRYNMYISLSIQQSDLYTSSQPVSVGNLEQIMLNNQPAALIRGTWDLETGKWDMDPPYPKLVWRQGDITYSLATTSMHIALKDLIRMAESVK